MKIAIEIKNCMDCPFLKKEKEYTGDSWDTEHNWFCKKKKSKIIAKYVEWHEEKKVPIPEWCPVKIEETNPPTGTK